MVRNGDSESLLRSRKLGFRSIVTNCRAVLLPRFGGPELLELRHDVNVPDLKPNEVLVRARAVSINPLDTRVSPHAIYYVNFFHFYFSILILNLSSLFILKNLLGK